jgi:hypothetical protein
MPVAMVEGIARPAQAALVRMAAAVSAAAVAVAAPA